MANFGTFRRTVVRSSRCLYVMLPDDEDDDDEEEEEDGEDVDADICRECSANSERGGGEEEEEEEKNGEDSSRPRTRLASRAASHLALSRLPGGIQVGRGLKKKSVSLFLFRLTLRKLYFPFLPPPPTTTTITRSSGCTRRA